MKNEQVPPLEKGQGQRLDPDDMRYAHQSKLKTGILMVSSALLGGIAFAIWNRRQIASIHNQPVPGAQSAPAPDDDAIY